MVYNSLDPCIKKYTVYMLSKEHLKEKNIIEVLGLESLPLETQEKIVSTAVEVVDMRCLDRILGKLDDQEKESLIELLEKKNEENVSDFFRQKNINIPEIIEEEIQRFKEETAKKFTAQTVPE